MLFKTHKRQLLVASPRVGFPSYGLRRFGTTAPLSNANTVRMFKPTKSMVQLKVPNSSVGVFWDWENCPIPLGDFTSRLSMMYDIAQSLGRQITFKVYMDSVQGTTVRSRLSSAGLEIVDCPHDNMKEVVDKAIINDMWEYACDNPAPSSIVLITGDRGYALSVSRLTLRGYHMVMVAPEAAHARLQLALFNEIYDWSNSTKPAAEDAALPSIIASASKSKAQIEDPPTAPSPHSPRCGNVMPAQEQYFTSAAKPVTTLARQKNSSKGTGSKADVDEANERTAAKLRKTKDTIESKFRPIVDALRLGRSQGNPVLSLSQLGAALLQTDPGVYKKVGVAGAKKYATLAHKHEVVVFPAVKAGPISGAKVEELVALHPRLQQ